MIHEEYNDLPWRPHISFANYMDYQVIVIMVYNYTL